MPLCIDFNAQKDFNMSTAPIVVSVIIILGYLASSASTQTGDVTNAFNCTNGVIPLSCPGCVIDVTKALYGHPKRDRGKCSTDQGDCFSPADEVKRRCHRKRKCDVIVSQQRTTDRCPDVSSYVTMEYTCRCANCKALLPIDNGQIKYSEPRPTSGTTAKFVCNSGYDLVGPKTRICGPDGEWNNIYTPRCSIPKSRCPRSSNPVRSFGAFCYEFVHIVRSWDQAARFCEARHAQFVRVDSLDLLGFLNWQLRSLDMGRYVWLNLSSQLQQQLDIQPTTTTTTTTTRRPPGVTAGPRLFPGQPLSPPAAPCHELSRPGTGAWKHHLSDCSLLNKFICRHDPIPLNSAEVTGPESSKGSGDLPSLQTNVLPTDAAIGLGVGIGLGLVILIIVLVLVCCKKRKGKEKPYSTMEDGTTHQGNSSQEQEDEAVYDDTELPNATPVTNNDRLPYAKVNKHRSQPVVNYDEVYTPAHSELHPTHTTAPGKRNSYENVTLHNLVGSLKKKLGSDKPPKGEHGEENKSPRPQTPPKPKPAPKPAARRGVSKDYGEGDQGLSPDETCHGQGQGQCQGHLLRPANENGRGTRGNSQVELVDNELYDRTLVKGTEDRSTDL